MPPDLNIVHLTPGRLARRWSTAQPSPAFRSPPPWLSRRPSVPQGPYPSDIKIDIAKHDANNDRPPQYSWRNEGHSRTGRGLPIRYHVKPYSQAGGFSERSRMIQDFFSELFGTFIMILLGDGVVAQVTLSRETKGDSQSINWAWG